MQSKWQSRWSYQLLPQCLASHEADNATGGIGNLLLQGLLVDSQCAIQQELLRICMLSGRKGKQLSGPVRASPQDLWHDEVQQSLQLRFGKGGKDGGKADERAAITTELEMRK
jgi:hypothetical protein